MNNNIAILDASALIALIQQEKGANIVKPLLKYSTMSTVNIAEVATSLQRINIYPDQSMTLIQDILKNIVPFDFEHSRLTAQLQSC